MTLYFVIGPTAVGKTAAGIEWALANNAEILCADAPLVYKGMDIGTAKPTKEERAKVPHWGIDLISIKEIFNVGQYAAYAQEKVKEIEGRGKKVLVVGGSGFYLKSFFKPVTDGVPVSQAIVKEVAELYAKEGLPGLVDHLKRVGGEDLTGLDVKNPRRVMKALERCLGSGGKSFQELHRMYKSQEEPFPMVEKRVVLLVRPKEELKERIERRVDVMIESGLIEEVKALKAAGLEENPVAAKTIGYKETLEYLAEKIGLDELKEQIVKNTLMLVRKQMTFFKQFKPTKTLLLTKAEALEVKRLFD